MWLLEPKVFNHLYGPEAEPEGGAQAMPKTGPPFTLQTPFSIKCQLATGSPQSILINTHSFLNTQNTLRLVFHTTHTRAHLISYVGGVTTRHRNHIIRFKRSSASIQLYGPLDHTGLQCLINRHGLTFHIHHAPKATFLDSKVTPHPGHAHLSLQPGPAPQCQSIGS